MGIKFDKLEKALYHIRVNYFGCDTDDLVVRIRELCDGDAIIGVWTNKNEEVGKFFLSTVITEITLLQQGKIDFCDLSANNMKEDR